MELSPRQQIILKVIIGEYVATGLPVGSATVLRRGDLGVSSATIRNEMAALEETQYIAHPHTSAGRIPSDLGYRYYIECLMDEADLSPPEKTKIRHQFHQVELDVDEWAHLAASVLARSVSNAALVTRPRSTAGRLKEVHLVGLNDRLVLAIVVLQDGGLRQHFHPLDDVISGAELTRLGNRLTAEGAGLTGRELQAKWDNPADPDEWATRLVARLMQSVEARQAGSVRVEGVRYVLQQREFGEQEKALQVLDTLENQATFAPLLSELEETGGVRIIIGRENQQTALRDLSLILARYGSPDDLVGTVGVVGPTRMAYDRILPAVRYLVGILNDLVAELHA